MPPVAFRNWPNAHNFYGDFNDLDAANLGDVKSFFHTYYAPNNAVLLVLGDVDPAESFALAKAILRIHSGRPEVPPRVDATEPPQIEERRGEVSEKFGPLPAMAIGYRAPARGTPDWYTAGILDRLLHGGRAGRIYRRLVLESQIAIEASGGINYSSGDLFDYNGPTLMITTIYHKPEYSSDQTIAAFEEIMGEIRDKGIDEDELRQIQVKFRSDFYSHLESGMGAHMPRFGLMHYLACFTLFDNDPQLINSVLDKFLAVTPDQVRDVARKMLVPEQRSILIRRPVGKGGAQ